LSISVKHGVVKIGKTYVTCLCGQQFRGNTDFEDFLRHRRATINEVQKIE